MYLTKIGDFLWQVYLNVNSKIVPTPLSCEVLDDFGMPPCAGRKERSGTGVVLRIQFNLQ